MTDRNRQQIWFNYRFHPFPLRQQFAELLGGYIAGSLAIMSDAAHLLSDCISFIVALVAICLSKKSPDNYMTFGYKRVGKCVAYRNRKRLKWMFFFFFHSICDLFCAIVFSIDRGTWGHHIHTGNLDFDYVPILLCAESYAVSGLWHWCRYNDYRFADRHCHKYFVSGARHECSCSNT